MSPRPVLALFTAACLALAPLVLAAPSSAAAPAQVAQSASSQAPQAEKKPVKKKKPAKKKPGKKKASKKPVKKPAPAKARTFANCTQLNQVYPHGVGRPGAVDSTSGAPVTNFVRDAALYSANKKSDRDKDGIACEKR